MRRRILISDPLPRPFLVRRRTHAGAAAAGRGGIPLPVESARGHPRPRRPGQVRAPGHHRLQPPGHDAGSCAAHQFRPRDPRRGRLGVQQPRSNCAAASSGSSRSSRAPTRCPGPRGRGFGDSGMERRVEAGDGRRVRQHTWMASGAARDFGWCSGARSVSLLDGARGQGQSPPGRRTGPRRARSGDRPHPPGPVARWLLELGGVGCAARGQVGGAGHRVGLGQQPQFQAAGPSVGDQDRRQYGHRQPVISGASSPCSRV